MTEEKTPQAVQFCERLDWGLDINRAGEERDQYDNEQASYLIYHRNNDRHLASIRIRPYDHLCMTQQIFADLVRKSDFLFGDFIEVTRFCSSPGCKDERAIAVRSLLRYLKNLIVAQDLDGAIAVFDRRMIPIYRRLGWPPHRTVGTGDLYLGLWKPADWFECSENANTTGAL